MIKKILKKIGKNSIISQKEIASAAHEKRNAVLKLSSEIIRKNTNKIIEANKSDSLLIMFKTEISDYYTCKRNDDIMKYANELLKMESYCGYKRWTSGNFVSDTYVSNFRYINQMITLSREKNTEFC